MTTAACVLVTDPAALQWLGPGVLLDRAVAALAGVRGVDYLCCACSEALYEDVQARQAPADILRFSMAEDEPGLSLYRRIFLAGSAVGTFDFALVLSPFTPFLAGTRAEECLSHVHAGRAHVAATGLNVKALVPATGGSGVMTAHDTAFVPILGALAFRIEHLATRGAAGWLSRFLPVPIGFAEAIDVSDPDQLLVAQAAEGLLL